MSEEMKPCACGCAVEHGAYEGYSLDSSFSAIICENCGMYFTGRIQGDGDESLRLRAEAWNSRAATPSPAASEEMRWIRLSKQHPEVGTLAMFSVDGDETTLELMYVGEDGYEGMPKNNDGYEYKPTHWVDVKTLLAALGEG